MTKAFKAILCEEEIYEAIKIIFQNLPKIRNKDSSLFPFL